jgi:YesN/AraC family two-component response regulator
MLFGFFKVLYTISEDFEKAKLHLDIAHSINPLSQETLFYQGYYNYRTGNYQDALKIFDECMGKNSMNIPAFVVRSYCLFMLNEFDKSLSYLEQMPEEIFPSDERLGIKTIAYSLKGDYKAPEFLSQLKKAAENPIAFQAHSYLYLTYAAMNIPTEAFKWIDSTIKLKSPIILLSFSDPIAQKIKTDKRYSEFSHILYKKTNHTDKKSIAKTPLLDNDTADSYSEKLYKHIDEEKPFLIPNLSLRMLAEQVDIHPNKLSWILNEKTGKNFNEFINHYRIQYFNTLSLDPSNSHISLIGLAFESGFNSKTVFNTYFKKEMGMTPKEFLKQNQS